MPIKLCRHPRHRSSRWRFYVRDTVDPNNVLSIRLVTPDDGIRERLFFEDMNSKDRYTRFFHPKKNMSDKEVHGGTFINYRNSFKVAAVSRATDKFVGTACFMGGGGIVEAAVCVLDPYKGKGLGAVLVDLLWRAAIEEFKVKRLRIEHLTTNGAVRRVFERAAKRYAVGCKEEPPEDGVRAVTWELKPSLEDVELEVQEVEDSMDTDGGPEQMFEVLRPAAHPLSLWRFELRMLVPHEGAITNLEVRPLTPDDERREAAYLQVLDARTVEWVRTHHLKAHQRAHADSQDEAMSASSEAQQLTHYTFGKEFAIAAIDVAKDSIVAIARWVEADPQTGEVEAFLSVLESWRGLGICRFVLDVIIQSAIMDGKKLLAVEVPAGRSVLKQKVEEVAAKHAVKVRTDPGSDENTLRLVAELKGEVDHPIRFTRLPSTHHVTAGSLGGSGAAVV